MTYATIFEADFYAAKVKYVNKCSNIYSFEAKYYS